VCPSGEGYYCGNNPHVPDDEDLSNGVLYYCEDGDYSKVDTCTNNDPYEICQVKGGGHDECVEPSPECPSGNDGYYCGNNPHVPDDLHLVNGRLYECKDGHYSRVDTCTNNPTGGHPPFQVCKVNGYGHDECVDPAPAPAPPPPSPGCPGGKDGQYCGNNPLVPSHYENGVLYTCVDGHYNRHIDCEDLHPPYFCHISSSYGYDTCKPVPFASPTGAPSSKPSAFCDDDDNKNACPATTPGPPFPECVGDIGVSDRCQAYTERSGNTAKCYEATKLLLNTKMGSMETIMNHAKKFKYGVYCGDFNGCDESTGCCDPPHPCDDKNDNGVDQSCKANKDCEADAGGDYTKLLQCEASFVQDLQHAYIASLKDGEPEVNGFCDKKWYDMNFTVPIDQGTLITTGANFFKHESILNAFSPCCSPYGVRQCLGSGGSKVDECHDDNILCFCKSIAEQFKFLGGDYTTCANSYNKDVLRCEHVSETGIPFPLH